MRRFDKDKNMIKANILVELRHLASKGLINEEIYDLVRDLKSAFGGRLPSQGEAEEYLGRELNDYEEYEIYGTGSYTPERDTYAHSLTSQSSKYEIGDMYAVTDKAVRVEITRLEDGRKREMWIPKSQIKNDVVPAWLIKKNF